DTAGQDVFTETLREISRTSQMSNRSSVSNYALFGGFSGNAYAPVIPPVSST
ncbi:unnamed protein product, partial [Amoebophrya sp. A120]